VQIHIPTGRGQLNFPFRSLFAQRQERFFSFAGIETIQSLLKLFYQNREPLLSLRA
jgi:hypothetical protein